MSAATEDPGLAARAEADVAVVVDGLVKRYPKSPVNAVDGVSFTVSPGEVFGLLGPNGAGKTTTVGVLTTRVRPTAGRALVAGVDAVGEAVRVRRLIAVVPQRSNLDRSLSIRDNLIFHAAYHGVPARERGPRADELLDQFDLLERASSKPDFFSGGQAQRVMIARALMHAPTVLFLDEPTTGLDPVARLFVWDRLLELKRAGVTLVLTTHDMDEAAALADRIGIMDRGRLLALDTPAGLMHSLPGGSTLDLTASAPAGADFPAAVARLAELPGVQRVEPADGDGAAAPNRVRLYLSGEAPSLVAPAAAVLADYEMTLTDVSLGTPTLEDVFIALTGRVLA
ncbi:MAG: ABC transporter ATP-binding protein [Actinomycetota bacterium]|nr:ABC transporter ATP-binding protein [Actinomycetota bacterium]